MSKNLTKFGYAFEALGKTFDPKIQKTRRKNNEMNL